MPWLKTAFAAIISLCFCVSAFGADISSSAFVRGQSAWIHGTGFAPNSTVYLLHAGQAGNGPCAQNNAICVDILGPQVVTTKTANPNVKVAMGGNHASNTISDYEFALRNPECGIPTTIKELDDPNIDVLVRGEADFIAPVLADRLANDQNIHNLDGVAIKSNGSYRINAAPPRLEAAKLPIPRRDLMNMEGYFNLGMYHSPTKGGERALNVMASRGCPEKCSFCTTPAMWGAKVRWRNVDDIVAEIERSIEEYGIEQIQFEDDTITANKSKAIDLFTKVGRFGKKLFVPNGSKANYHKRHQLEMYKVMADAGMHQINIAAESGSQRVLDQVIHKNLKTDEVLNAIDNAKEAGIPKVHVFYVVGMVGETRAEIEETLEFARTAGSDSYSIAMFAPLPGTPMYHQVMKQDLWWPGVEPSDIIYNRSLIRVDGFSNPKEFEAFIEAHSKSKKLT